MEGLTGSHWLAGGEGFELVKRSKNVCVGKERLHAGGLWMVALKPGCTIEAEFLKNLCLVPLLKVSDFLGLKCSLSSRNL